MEFGKYLRNFALAILVHPLAISPVQAAPTIDQIRRAIENQRTSINSMGGVYTTTTTPDELATKSMKTRQLWKTMHIQFAWSGPKRMLEQEGEWVTLNEGSSHVSSVNVFDGGQFRRRTGKDFLIQKSKSPISELNTYLYDLRWPFAEVDFEMIRRDPMKTRFIPNCLESQDWQVRQERPTIDGVRCVVLERRNMGWRIFLDEQRNYGMIRAEYDRPTDGYIKSSYSYRKHKEVSRGIFLPMEIETEVVTEDGGKPTGTLTTHLIVEDLHVNDVKDSAFRLEPNPGDYVMDKIKNQVYNFTTINDNLLDVVAEKAAINLKHSRISEVTRFFAFGQIGFVIGVSLIFLSFYVRRLISRRGRAH